MNNKVYLLKWDIFRSHIFLSRKTSADVQEVHIEAVFLAFVEHLTSFIDGTVKHLWIMTAATDVETVNVTKQSSVISDWFSIV